MSAQKKSLLFIREFISVILILLSFWIVTYEVQTHTPDDKKISVEGYNLLIECQYAIKSVASILDVEKFNVGYLSDRLLGSNSWLYIGSHLNFKQCIQADKIDEAFTKTGFHRLDFYVRDNQLTGIYCKGDIELNISGNITGTGWGALCKTLTVTYRWEKNSNLNNPQCWDAPIKAEDATAIDAHP